MTPQQVFDFFGDGTPARAAKRLGLTRQALYYWRDVGVPEVWQFKLERLTAGKLKREAPARAVA